MNSQIDPVLELKSRIARSKERSCKWENEANGAETSWTGGYAYREFCKGMARAAREKQVKLEAQLQHLQAKDMPPPGRQRALLESA